MMRTLISLLFLMLLASHAHSNDITTTLGINLDQAMSLLESEPPKRTQEKIASKPPVQATVSTKPKVEKAKKVAGCQLAGKVISVTDGDTVQVLDAQKKRYKIRLAGIDAPERGQPYGKAATKYLKSMIGGKHVCVEWYKKDRYQRLVGVIHYNNQDINYQMVRLGYAWHFKKYQKEQTPSDRILYTTAQINSRLNLRGLWQEPNPLTPSQWRSGQRPKKKIVARSSPLTPKATTKPRSVQATSNFSCSGKRFCKQMNSCAEACFYLNQCGLGRLDRDKDGIPCESICGGC